MFTDDKYLADNPWPGGVALLIAGTACWFLGGWLRSRHNRVLFDRSTGEDVILRPGTSFFFIPMRAWGPILALFGIFLISGNIIERMSSPSLTSEGKLQPPGSDSSAIKESAEQEVHGGTH